MTTDSSSSLNDLYHLHKAKDKMDAFVWLVVNFVLLGAQKWLKWNNLSTKIEDMLIIACIR